MIARARLLLLLLGGTVLAPAAEPVVNLLVPRGGQRGKEVVVTFYGQRLADAVGAILHGEGIELVKVESADDRKAVMRLRLAPDCPLGRHALRLRTKSGLSNILTFHVGVLPELTEKESNNSAATAQVIPLNVTIGGRVLPEDVDVFRVDIPAATRVVFEVEGIRLGGPAFDPHLEVRDAEGNVVVSADDGPFGRMDPVCEHLFEKAGAYDIVVREAAWGGSGRSYYRLHVGTFPRPVGAIPCAGRPGETLKVRLFEADGSEREAEVEIPATMNPGRVFNWFPEDERGIAPTPVPLLVSKMVAKPEPATRKVNERTITVPGAIDGTLSKPNELDVYRFKGKRGQRFEVRVHARALRSPVDPVAQVVDPDGRNVRFGDDNGGPDSRFSVRLPKDGTYSVRLRDHLRRGGPGWFYRLEVGPSRRPVRATVINRRRRDLSAISIPRGGHMSVLLRGLQVPRGRKLELVARDLPEGVTFETVPFMGETGQLPVIFHAAADAPISGGRVVLDAVPRDDKAKPTADCFRQRLPLVYVRNDQVYLDTIVERLPVAVTKAAPFSVTVTQPKVPIVQGGPMRLEVKVTRQKGFKGAVRIEPLWNPPGIRAGGFTIPADKSSGMMPLSANGQVPPRVWKFAVIASAQVAGPLRVSSPFIDLESVRRLVSLKPEKVRGEIGTELALKATMKAGKPFAGTAKLSIMNLPRDVTAAPLAVKSDTKSVSFAVKLGKKAPPGRHRNLLFRMEVPSPEGILVHTWRSGELRIDRPLKRRPKSAKAKKGPAKKKPARGTVANPKT